MLKLNIDNDDHQVVKNSLFTIIKIFLPVTILDRSQTCDFCIIICIMKAIQIKRCQQLNIHGQGWFEIAKGMPSIISLLLAAKYFKAANACM